VLPEAETKTRVPLEMPWPEALVPALDTWLATYRPILAAATGRWHRPAGAALWVSADGSPMTEMALYDRIVAATRTAFGRSINPHLFRDCAVTSIAIEAPGDIGIAGPMLGHCGRRTAEQHYNQAHSISAARRLQAVLIALGDATLLEPGDTEDPS
jgi:integrase/recombinase XerD